MLQPNTLLASGDVENCVLLVGGEDPPLVIKIIKQLVRIKLIKESRGFLTYKCLLKEGKAFSLMITGIGPSCTEIAFNELAKCGARQIIRAGTCASLKKELELGSVVITLDALRFDGVSDFYVNKEYQPKAEKNIIEALENSARELNIKYEKGTTLSTSSFYAFGGESDDKHIKFGGFSTYSDFNPPGLGLIQDIIENKLVLNVEMETATLLTLSNLNDLKSGSVCGISNYIPWKEGEQFESTEIGLRSALSVAIKAIENIFFKKS